MKKILILLIAAIFVAFTGCKKDDDNPQGGNGNNGDGTIDTTSLRSSRATLNGRSLAEFDYLSYTVEDDGTKFYAIPDSIVIGHERAVIITVTPSGGAGWRVDDNTNTTRFYLAEGATLTFKARAEANPMYFTDLFLNAYTCSWDNFEFTHVTAHDWSKDGHLKTELVREFSLTRTGGGEIGIDEILVHYMISENYQQPGDDPHPGGLSSAEFDFTVLPDNPGDGTPVNGGTAYTFPAGQHYPDGNDAVQFEVITNDGATAARYIDNGHGQIYLDIPKGNVLKLRPRGGVELNRVKFDIEFSEEPNPYDFVITNAEPGDEVGVLNVTDKTAEMSIKINDAASMQSIKLKKIKVYYTGMPK